jgi:type II restriction/modification system DNA methylase subunit YeeA
VTPDDFIRKWKASTLSERSAAHSHFIDLCGLLDEPTPTDSDQTGDNYTFEKGATKTTGGKGWADVWKRDCFAWEYKGKHKSLTTAFAQLQQYTPMLGNPPLLIVCDMDQIEVHTNWTSTIPVTHHLDIEDLRDAAKREFLKSAFAGSESLKPGLTRRHLTEAVAREFAQLAWRLQSRGHDPHEVAHFVNQLVFCMFAEDVALLPDNVFKKMLRQGIRRPDLFSPMAKQLFGAMQTGGLFGAESINWFNGGLFDSDKVLPLEKDDLAQILRAAEQDWRYIDPSVLGTLFERGLDPDKRGQLGAHYTDEITIMRLINPVIVAPLTQEWESVKAQAKAKLASSKSSNRVSKEAERMCTVFLERLRCFRVLDPACGSGNFLYLALKALKTLEHVVGLQMEEIGFGRPFPTVGPEAVIGIEINPYAAELARVAVWIGEIQWMRLNGYNASLDPILKRLNNILCHDAVLAADGTQTAWPAADVLVGNPPFLGGKRMRSSLGDEYCARLFAAYKNEVSAEADLVCYWVARAQKGIVAGEFTYAGLVTTNSIRSGANRRVLEPLARASAISTAWSDEPWTVEGAAVRVSLICWGRDRATAPLLNGLAVPAIHADLTSGADLTAARRLPENAGIAFMGDTKGGAFDVPGELARRWLLLPTNPNGRPNTDVLRPWANGMDLTRRPSDTWIIDFGWSMTEGEAAYYTMPYAHVVEHVRPLRKNNKREAYASKWWRHVEARPGMHRAIAHLPRFIATPRVAKHRTFSWLENPTLADARLFVFARDDDFFFGILHSRIHEVWSLATASWHGVGNDPTYNATVCFETFPFPAGVTPDHTCASYGDDPRSQAISEAAQTLVAARDRWLNPAELVNLTPEVVDGFPDRILPRDETAAVTLRSRTMTALYNMRGEPEGAWLDGLHSALDTAVADAYGWPADLDDGEVLVRLLALNHARSSRPAGDERPIYRSPIETSP